MLKRSLVMILTALSAVVLCKSARSEPITYYHHLTHLERTVFDELIWFLPGDTVWGPIRSNDTFGLRGGVFMGQFISSAGRPDSLPEDIHFEIPPIFNAPPFRFPQSMPHLREMAGITVNHHGGSMMTRFKLFPGSIEIHQYALGTPPQDSLIWALGTPFNQVIFVNGQVEVMGVLTGRLTIVSAGDMWLIDDIRYFGSDPRTGMFNEEDMYHMLGLVSERNVIIRNNEVNGRGNGWDGGQNPDEIDQHSIIINASIVALGGSFTFQHQNDDWDLYQGPTPDERGIIHLKGGVAQWRRGYVHRTNHQGTGFGKDYHYDFRLDRDGPPGFGPGEYPDLEGNYDRLLLFRGPYTIRRAVISSLIILPEVVVNLEGINAASIRDTLLIQGTPDRPVTIQPKRRNNRAGLSTRGGDHARVDIQNAVFLPSVELRLAGDSIRVSNCRFGGEVYAEGNAVFDSCYFEKKLEITSWGSITLSRSVLEDGVVINGDARAVNLTNNTIFGSRSAGVELDRFQRIELVNNIIVDNRFGVVNNHWLEPVIRFCDVYNNAVGNYLRCSAGEGCFSADPEFVDWRREDFHLWAGSPCIDAGDPDSQRDSDGSRSDVGAFAFQHDRSIEPQAKIPQDFDFSVTPNPFNDMTSVRFATRNSATVQLDIFDVSGRNVASESRYFNEGMAEMIVRGTMLGSSGVYIARISSDTQVSAAKLVYLP